MKFYHSTDSSVVVNIEKPEDIMPSVFEFDKYIKHLTSIKWTFQEETDLPHRYYDENEQEMGVYWLGTGVYCFNEADKELAEKYSKKHDTLICLKTFKNPKIFKMDSKPNRLLLYKFVIEGFLQLENLYSSEEEKSIIRELKDVLQASLLDNFVHSKAAAGILIEVFKEIMEDDIKMDLVENTFTIAPKGVIPFNVRYVCIKNLDIIENISSSVIA